MKPNTGLRTNPEGRETGRQGVGLMGKWRDSRRCLLQMSVILLFSDFRTATCYRIVEPTQEECAMLLGVWLI